MAITRAAACAALAGASPSFVASTRISEGGASTSSQWSTAARAPASSQRLSRRVVRAAASEPAPATKKPAADSAPKATATAEAKKPKSEAEGEPALPEAESEKDSSSPAPKPSPPKKPKPTNQVPPDFEVGNGLLAVKKGQVVRVDKEKYLDSVEYYAVAHPRFYKGIDYIYEDRGEVLDIRFYEAGEYALVSWAGIPTSPAWLPTYMLIESEKLSYKRE